MPPKGSQESEGTVELSEVPASVIRVHFDGVRRSSRALLQKQVRHVFGPSVSNFKAMLEAAEEARDRLQQLGVFKDMALLIDVPLRDEPEQYELIFSVKEHQWWRMGVSALSSLDNRASLVTRGAITNVTGAAERLEVDWHVGVNRLAEQQRLLTFVKPLEDAPAMKFNAGLFDNDSELSWVSMAERSRGVFIGMQWPTFAGDHSLRLEGQWRHLRTAERPGVPLALREETGHFLRYLLKHDFRSDSRDDLILPVCGGLAKMRQELAMGGAGHEQAHLLHDVELQWNTPLYENPATGACVSLQVSQSCGLINSISDNRVVSAADRFFLGGPLSLRGYEIRQAGPIVHEAAPEGKPPFQHLKGGRAYSLSGLHVYSTLPYLGAREILQNIRLHAFASAGTIGDREPKFSDPFRSARLLAEQARLSFGLGVVVRLFGFARFEVNYCWPMWFQPTDKVHPGLQCGIGIEYQ